MGGQRPRRTRRRRHPESAHAPLDAPPIPALAGDVLELRIHGVSGTPPEELLDRPLVRQIAGDRIAGFHMPYESTDSLDAAPSPFAPRRPGAPHLAGYTWGGLTSGSPARALWLLLLPFTLVNVAPRARPAGRERESLWVRTIWYLTRLLALALTCLYLTTAIGVGEDLIGWQCPGSDTDSCADASPGWIFHGLGVAHRLSAEHMLLIGTALPVVLLLALWRISSRTANRYERTVADLGAYRAAVDVQGADDTNAVELPLSSALMWRNAEQVRRLRAVHLQVGFALVLWTVLGVTNAPRDTWYDFAAQGWPLVPVVVLAYALVVLAVPSYTGHGRSPGWRIASGIVWAALAVSGLVQIVGLAVAHRWVDEGFVADEVRGAGGDAVTYHRVPQGTLPYFPGTVLIVCAAAAAALAALLAVVVAARIADVTSGRGNEAAGVHRPVPIPLAGLGTGAFASLGVFLAAAFSSGAYVLAATWLTTGSAKPGFHQVADAYGVLTVPPAIGSANQAYALAVAVLGGLVVVAALVVAALWKFWPGNRLHLARDYPRDAGASDDDHAHRDRQIRRDMLLGRLVDHAQWFVAAMVISGLALVTWFGIRLARNDGNASKKILWMSAPTVGGVGAYLAVLTVLGLVLLGALAFRARATRRGVGILWDVAAFWPRSAHPLTAPCYAERTVPDLVTFITAYRVRHRDGALVLAAHSQGTVISAATIRQLGTFDAMPGPSDRLDVVPRIAFLSFGCVLRRLYGRFFPTYFGPSELHALETDLGGTEVDAPRWRNLWRYTDYLGGQVTAGPPQAVPDTPATVVDPAALLTDPPVRGPVSWEWHSPDPAAFGRRPGDTTYPATHRHSEFWSDESGYLQLAAAELAALVRAAPADPPTDGDGARTAGRP